MNKELEALERLNNGILVYGEHLYKCNLLDGKLYRKNIKSIGKYYDLLKQAFKRNEPMKVDLEAKICIYSVDYYGCPNCTGRQIEREYRYCPDCGQALDWSDDE